MGEIHVPAALRTRRLPLPGRRTKTADAVPEPHPHVACTRFCQAICTVEQMLGRLSRQLNPSTVRQTYSVTRDARSRGTASRGPERRCRRLTATMPTHSPRAAPATKVRELTAALRASTTRAARLVATTGTGGKHLGCDVATWIWTPAHCRSREISCARRAGWRGTTNRRRPGSANVPLAPVAVEHLREHRRQQLEDSLRAGAAWQDIDPHRSSTNRDILSGDSCRNRGGAAV
jgi:hypothetical protein